MPTYLNSGTVVKDVSGLRVEPGESLQSIQWAGSLPAGVTITSENPFYNPIIYSTAIAGGGTYEIPNNLIGNYKVTFYCATGTITAKLSSSNGTARVLAAGETWTVMCLARIVDSLIWATTGTGSVTVESI